MNSKTTESKTVNRSVANTHVQAKLNINRPGDRYEAEADRAAAAVVDHISGRSKNNPTKPASVEVSRLQKGTTDPQRQCCEEEEMQTKLQRQSQEEEEMQMKVQRQAEEEEEEMQMKIQRQAEEEEEEEMQMKVQRQAEEEEEEMQMKIQRQPVEEEEEEMQMKLQRQAEEEEEEMQMKIQQQAEEEEEEKIQMKVQRQAEEEEEEMQMKIQRQSGEEEDEEMQTKLQRCGEDEMHAKENTSGNSDSGASSQAESRINQRRGKGAALDDRVKGEMESGFGADFSSVRVHKDAEASQISDNLNAQAFTTGNDIYFSEGKYQPESSPGKTLLAHELTHVIQQGGAAGNIARKNAAGERVDEEPVKGTPDNKLQSMHISAKEETEIQREVGDAPDAGSADAGPTGDAGAGDAGATGDSGDATPADEGGEPPEPAAPTLNLTPGNTLTRGDNLKATIMFQPNGAETYRVTSWRFSTAEHGNVDRPSADAEFQNKWDGTMAVSGTLEMTYRITPEGGTEGPEQTLSEEITVEDRTGDEWEAEVDEQNEAAYSAAPSPPTSFPHLGHHNANVVKPVPNEETISGGPNRNFRFVKEMEAGEYPSSPLIHPDLHDNTSDFFTFHQRAGLLFLESGNTRTQVPRSEYSNLAISGNNFTFDVPDWDTFYKGHDIVRVTATREDGSHPFVVPESAWELDSNDRDSNVTITDENVVRTGLGIGPNDGYRTQMEFVKDLSVTPLMQSSAILAGTQSHEYAHDTHSHRANFVKMVRALDPEKKIENKVSAPGHTENFNSLLTNWRSEIMEAVPTHDLVDEAASEEQEEFVAIGGETMAGINTNPDTGDNLGAVWNISSDSPMGN